MATVNFNDTTPAAPGGNTNVTWQRSGDNVSAYAPNSASPLTTKGDVFGHSTVDARIPVGSDGKVLTADSGAALGVSWQTPSSGGGFTTQTDVSGSRSANTVYQNTTGQWMLVSIVLTCASGGTGWLYYGSGSSPSQKVQAVTMASGGFSGTLTFLVKPNYYYELSGDGGSVTGTTVWYESY